MVLRDKTKVVPYMDFIEREIGFLSGYEADVDWKVYQSVREKRLEIERWVECLINATIDLSKMFLVIKGEGVPETSRELLFKMASFVFDKEEDGEAFSELARIRNALAHRYLDIKWEEIKRFIQIARKLHPSFIAYLKRQILAD